MPWREKMFDDPILCAECGKLLKIVFIVILCNECLEKAIKQKKTEVRPVPTPLEPVQA
jgi:hypothetical protein